MAYLETEYVEWCDKLGGAITEKSIEVIVKQICLQSLDIQNARLAGSDVSKKIKTLRDLLSDGGLVEKQNNAVVNLASVGQRIEEIEKMRPICSPDKDLTDVDNVKKIVIGFVGSTCRALGKENKYTKEFSKLYKPYEINIIEGIDEEDE